MRRNFSRASDAELFRAGDVGAFAEIYDRNVRQVFGWGPGPESVSVPPT